MTRSNYRIDIDGLKGIAIISVILYHIGILPYGYLGVDTFFVINGFFVIPSLINQINKNQFSYFPWLYKKIIRFLPLVLLASTISLIVGFFTMIPDDYENLSASVVASNFFSNNILSAITTRNYWDSSNIYKPLMHLWYLGILMQFYFFIPLLYLTVKKITGKFFYKRQDCLFYTTILATIFSLALYLIPTLSSSDKFYFLQYRLWELLIGGVIGYYMSNHTLKINKPLIPFLCIIGIIIIYCFEFTPLLKINNLTIVGEEIGKVSNYGTSFLILTVLLTCICIIQNNLSEYYNRYTILNAISKIGKVSFSIYIWHQVILAFTRYSIVDNLTYSSFILFVLILTIISYLSYKYLEHIKFKKSYSKIFLIVIWGSITSVAFLIYRHAGVVRDVPELGISYDNPFVCRNTEYTDKIYDLDKPFTEENNCKILIVGNSFARDFACVLLESEFASELNISYQFSLKNHIDSRLSECDYLFIFGPKHKVLPDVWKYVSKDCKVIGIGTKSYGSCFGRIYAKRYHKDYFETSIPINKKCEDLNQNWKQEWGENNYIDFMTASKINDNEIRVFTPDHMIISFDCRHLTKAGCKFYANTFNWEQIFSKNVS